MEPWDRRANRPRRVMTRHMYFFLSLIHQELNKLIRYENVMNATIICQPHSQPSENCFEKPSRLTTWHLFRLNAHLDIKFWTNLSFFHSRSSSMWYSTMQIISQTVHSPLSRDSHQTLLLIRRCLSRNRGKLIIYYEYRYEPIWWYWQINIWIQSIIF